METVLIVFMSLVSLICLFAILLIIKDMIENKRESKERKKRELEASRADSAKCSTLQTIPPVTPLDIEPECENINGAVSFEAEGVKMTLDDKYNALDKDSKGYYDEIVKCAGAVEGVKRFKNSRYEEYKVGNSRVVRILIKRDTVVCEFILQNTDFKDYVSQNKVAIRPAPTVLKITNSEMLKTACDSIAIVVKQIDAEKEAKRQEMLERRREKRKAKNQAAAE